ncbi:MAG TPA: iron ABC transporter permease [Actinomycetota bacterium]
MAAVTEVRGAKLTVRPTRLRAWLLVAALGCLAGAVLLGVLVGPVRLPAGAVLKEFVNRLPLIGVHSGLSQLDAAILWQIRVPRVVLGGLVGAMLAMAGASYQGVFRNPLADPYLLGVAAGAGLGATLAVAYLPGRAGWPADPLPLTAFAGALVAVAATYVLGRSGIRSRNTATLILAGVAVAAFFTAAQTYAQQQHADTLREVYAWILGGLGTAAWRQVALILPYVAASGLALLLHRRLLDVMSLGDEEADSLGIRATRVRLTVVIIATLGTAAAVAVSGLIGFVGIIVPHTVRLLAGSSYRRILPLSVIFGAAFLILADLIARTALSPAEIPIGVITAFVGAPFFLLVLRRTRRLS